MNITTSNAPFGMSKVPYGWNYMPEAFIGFVNFSIGKQEFIDAFKLDTGHDLMSLVGGSPIDQMIDKQLGRVDAVMVEFMDWIVENYWGEDESGT